MTAIEKIRMFVEGCGSMGDEADIAFLRGPKITLGDLRELLAQRPEEPTRMTPELWGKLHIAIGCAREYPEFDDGSPIRTMLDDALAELNKLESAMRASMNKERS